MDEHQRRLIDYARSLRFPAPPPPPAAPGPFEAAARSTAGPATLPPLTTGAVERLLAARGAASWHPGTEEVFVGADELPMGMPAAASPLGDAQIELGVRATGRILDDEPLTDAEQGAFEAIVLPGLRPVIDVRDGAFDPPPAGWEFLEAYRPLIDPLLPAIGRIDVPELLTLPYAGTGCFVGDGLLMTNRHVAALFTAGVGAGPRFVRFHPDLSPSLSSRYEVGEPERADPDLMFRVVEVLLIHPHWDVAVLRVQPAGDAPLPRPLRLARSRPADFGGGATPHIIVVGYPMLDSRSNIAEQQTIFRGIYGRKRLMPGFLRAFSEQRARWGAVQRAVTHDATTLGGNSGSAVVDLATGDVLALHFGGRYLVDNYGVPAWELAQDQHVLDLGVSFTGPTPAGSPSIVPVAPPTWLAAWQELQPLAAAERR